MEYLEPEKEEFFIAARQRVVQCSRHSTDTLELFP